MTQWQSVVNYTFLKPKPDDILIRANVVETSIAPALEVFGKDSLSKVWPDIVRGTHPITGNVHAQIPAELFQQINLDDFLAIKSRAVSSLERHGPNKNGDGFPAQELVSSYPTLIAKGFYREHNSFDPANAIGINAHAIWMPEEQYVIVVSLVAKERVSPYELNEIRRTLANRTSGVSIGCIAGSAQCSECGNIAHKVYEVCDHMRRGSALCVKGKRSARGHIAHDICRELAFYELTWTKQPADGDALSHYIMGADLKEPAAEGKAPVAEPVSGVTIPDAERLEKMIDKAVDKAFATRVQKIIKTRIDQELGPYFRHVQLKVKPQVEQAITEKKDSIEQTIKTGGDKE